MPEVAATRTPFTPGLLVAALTDAYRAQLGHDTAPATLAILCAQCALETNGGRACIQWNVANYKRGPGPDWCDFETTEWTGDPPTPHTMTCQFSAWPDLTSAVAFFLEALYTHWTEAWAGAVAGDADAFAAGLRLRGFYTAPEASYAAGVKRWASYYAGILAGDERVTEPEILSPGDAGALAVEGLLDEPDPTDDPEPAT